MLVECGASDWDGCTVANANSADDGGVACVVDTRSDAVDGTVGDVRIYCTVGLDDFARWPRESDAEGWSRPECARERFAVSDDLQKIMSVCSKL